MWNPLPLPAAGRRLGDAGVLAGGEPCDESRPFGWIFVVMAAAYAIERDGLLLLVGASGRGRSASHRR